MPTSLSLVGCGKTKRDEAAAAKRLYTSGYFSLKWAAAEESDHQRILSAEHGVVHPMTELEPYEASLNPRHDSYVGDAGVVEWIDAVTDSLAELIASLEVDQVEVLACGNYAEPLRKLQEMGIGEVDVEYTLEGFDGMGDQMHYLSERTADAGGS